MKSTVFRKRPSTLNNDSLQLRLIACVQDSIVKNEIKENWKQTSTCSVSDNADNAMVQLVLGALWRYKIHFIFIVISTFLILKEINKCIFPLSCQHSLWEDISIRVLLARHLCAKGGMFLLRDLNVVIEGIVTKERRRKVKKSLSVNSFRTMSEVELSDEVQHCG